MSTKIKTPWKRGTFTVASTGRSTATGIIHPSGMFALETGNVYITHVPTGLMISADCELTHAQARAYANAMAALPLDWGKVTNENIGDIKVKGMPLVDVLRTVKKEVTHA